MKTIIEQIKSRWDITKKRPRPVDGLNEIDLEGYRILWGDNPALRRRSNEVQLSEIQDPRIQKTIRVMERVLREYNLAGLAAPQIGSPDRIIMVGNMWQIMKSSRPKIMINPSIKSHSKRELTGWEECLSIHARKCSVKRWVWVEVSYVDSRGVAQRKKVDFYLARIIQHEIDHLDGVLITDKAEEMQYGF